MKRFFAFLLAAGAAIGAYFFLTLLLWQHRAIRDFQEVDARIVSAVVTRHSGKNATYSPDILYAYTVNGREYTSTQVLPISQSSSRSWAAGIVERYGGERPHLAGIEGVQPRAKAYVNMQNPEEAILVREYSFVPYLLTLGAALGSLLGLGFLTGTVGGGRDRMQAIALDESETRLLLPAKSLQASLRHAVLWLAGAAAVTLPLWAHWTLAAGQRSVVFSLAVLAGLAGLGIIVYRRWTLTRNMSDARVRVRPAPLVRGQAFEVEVEADVRAALRVTGARARVRCIEHYKEKRGNKTSYGSRVRGEEVAELAQVSEVAAGDVFTGKGEVRVNAHLPASTDRRAKGYPYYRWELRVEIQIEKHADYCAVFPLEAV